MNKQILIKDFDSLLESGPYAWDEIEQMQLPPSTLFKIVNGEDHWLTKEDLNMYFVISSNKIASRRKRLLAYLISGLLVYFPCKLLFDIFLNLHDTEYFTIYNFLGSSENLALLVKSDILSAILYILISILTYLHSSGNLGHFIFNLKVVDKSTRLPISPENGIYREIIKSVLEILFLPTLWILFDGKYKQNSYDKIVNTIVVKK